MLAKIDKDTLSDALRKASKVLEKKSYIDVLSQVRLSFSSDGLDVTATNLERSILIETGARASYDLDICVDGSLLSNIVSKIESREIVFDFHNDNKCLVISRSQGDISLRTTDAEKFPDVELKPKETDKWIRFDRYDLANTFKNLLCSIREDEVSRPTLIAEFLIDTNLVESRFEAFSTDLKRMAFVSGLCEKSDETDKAQVKLQIPTYAIRLLAPTLAETKVKDIFFSDTANHLFCKIGDNEFYSFRKVEAQTPAVKQFIENLKPVASFQIDSKELLKQIELVGLFSDDWSKSLKFEFAEDCLTLSAGNSEQGEMSEKIAVNFEGEPLTTAFDHSYITPILKGIDGEVKFILSPRVETFDGGSYTTYPTEIVGNENGVKSRFFVQSLKL